jgi:hypothetical protein
LIEQMMPSLALLLLCADPSWQTVSTSEGLELDRRPVPGNPYYEYRVTTDTDVPIDVLCDGVFEWGTVSTDHDELKVRRLLEDHGDLRVTYDQISTPVPVAARDLAFAMKRDKRADGTCRVDFYTVNEKAPPLPPGWVRMVKLKGDWLFEPGPSGTHVTYHLFSDPGGALPAAFVHGSQRDAALNTVKKGIRLSRDGATGARRP